MTDLATKIHVHVITKAKSNRIEMLSDTSYKIWTTSPAVENKANNKVQTLLAKYLKLPLSHVVLTHGEKSPKKTFLIIEK